MAKILLVEDEANIRSFIGRGLTEFGHAVTTAGDGASAWERIAQERFDLLVMDIMMPKLDGIRATLKIREYSSIPIIILSAKSEDTDKILGLNIGADDYIVKPFDSEVLILKIKAILSRSKHEEAEPKPKFITIGEYVFNTELRTITKNEEQIKLTPKEARLLELLYNYKDGLLPREKALTEIWGTNDYFTARSMDVYVTKLRKYFKDDQNIKIENVHGSGFRLVIEE